MKKHGLQLAALVLAVVLGHAMAVSSIPGNDKKKAAAKPAKALTYEQDSVFGERFLKAVQLREKGKFDSSMMYIDSCLQINPNSAVAHFMRAEYNASNDKDTLALQDYEAAATLEPDNDTYQERVAQMYIGTGNFAKATEAYEKLYKGHRDRDDVLNILVQLYRQQKDYDKMLDAINRLEQVDGESDQLSMMRMNAYELKGDEKGAYATLKGLADSHPNDPNFKLMLGNWLMQHKRQQEAYDIYTTVLKTEPDNAMAQSCMYDYYNETGQEAKAQEMMDKLLLGKETPSDTRIQFFRNAIQQNEKTGGDSTKIVQLFKQVQQVVPRDTTVAQLKAAYYTLKNFPKDSIDNALTELLKLQPDNAGARIQLIQDKWPSQDWKTIAVLSEPGMLYNPNELAFYFFTGLSRYYLKDDDGALTAMKKGTAFINDQSSVDIVSDLYSIMGEIYHSKGMNKEAYAAYDSCLQYKPDNTPTLNNYAYFLSVDGAHLDKAEQMSAKAIAAEPKNATYLDTYAWVLYKLGRYADAKIYIDQTLKFSTDSTSDNTLYEHAAEIYAQLGDYKSAVNFLQQAVKHGGDAKALEKKIRMYQKKIK
jgi:tetratricopeptide (TPR) repeat protein